LSFTEQRSLAGGSIAKSLSALRTAVTRSRVRVHGFGVHDRVRDRSRDRFCIRFYLCLFPNKNRGAVIERTVESSVTELVAGQMTRLRYRLPKSRWVLCVHRDGRSYCFLRDARCMPVQSRYNYRMVTFINVRGASLCLLRVWFTVSLGCGLLALFRATLTALSCRVYWPD